MNDLPRESPRTILFQFVLFPLGVVMIGVAIFFLFGQMAAEQESIPEYLSDIRTGSDHRKFQAAYQLSKSIKRGEAKQYPNLPEQVIEVYRSARGGDPRVRQYLTLVLGKLGDRRATPSLMEALQEPLVETRIYALLALSELGDRTAVPAIIQAARDPEKDVRKTAVFVLGLLGDTRAVPQLVESLTDGTSDVRFNAAVALARFGDGRASPVLAEMLDRERLDRVPGMRPEQKDGAMIAAITAYAKIAPEEARAALAPIAARDPSMRVRSAARSAIETR